MRRACASLAESRSTRAGGGWKSCAGMLLLGCLLVDPVPAQEQSVFNTLHNLSASGPGEIRAVTESEVCKFCHVPHNAEVPRALWGHRLSEAPYKVPEALMGKGVRQRVGQPDGSSRLCLSCHDGTVALGDIAGTKVPIEMREAQSLSPGRKGFLGTDLSGSHPISFEVPANDPGSMDGSRDLLLYPLSAIQSDPDVKLDSRGKMQCTTCHDPHSDANYRPGQVPRFWVKSTLEGVCLTCHVAP